MLDQKEDLRYVHAKIPICGHFLKIEFLNIQCVHTCTLGYPPPSSLPRLKFQNKPTFFKLFSNIFQTFFELFFGPKKMFFTKFLKVNLLYWKRTLLKGVPFWFINAALLYRKPPKISPGLIIGQRHFLDDGMDYVIEF